MKPHYKEIYLVINQRKTQNQLTAKNVIVAYRSCHTYFKAVSDDILRSMGIISFQDACNFLF